jgi:hypothetical protein
MSRLIFINKNLGQYTAVDLELHQGVEPSKGWVFTEQSEGEVACQGYYSVPPFALPFKFHQVSTALWVPEKVENAWTR